MFLFHFNPCGYGQEAFIMAESVEQAKEYLIKQKDLFDEYNRKFMNRKIDMMVNETDGYVVNKYKVGEPIFGEIS